VTVTEAAEAVRRWIRRQILASGGGHAGGSLSAADILAALYFGDVLRHDPGTPEWAERDRFILSKGHGSLALYAALALAGYFPQNDLDGFASANSALMNHPDGHRIPGVEISTGSLGHGLPIAVGIAMAARMRREDHYTFCLIGDGESQEGVIWEAAMAAAQWRLGRLVVIVDRNRIGNDGPVDDIVGLEPLAEKWRSFGWSAIDADGHDAAELRSLLAGMRAEPGVGPRVLIARTIKGYGLVPGLAGTGAAHYITGDRSALRSSFAFGGEEP
jgi:transketolase